MPENPTGEPEARRLADVEMWDDGVNFIVHGHGGAGVLNAATLIARAARQQGVDVAIVDVDREPGAPPSPRLPPGAIDLLCDRPVYSANTWHVVFPFMAENLARYEDVAGHARTNSVLTYWELPAVPARLTPALEVADEVFLISGFMAAALSAAGASVPITRLDVPVEVPRAWTEGLGRAHFGLPADDVLFLINWEYTSVTARKNPEAAIRAFELATSHGTRPGVRLVAHIMCHQGVPPDVKASFRSEIRLLRERLPGIIIIDRAELAYAEALALKACTDCFVSLHRSEGYGMGCAEALALGSHTIMTGWSGNMEFTRRPDWSTRCHPIPSTFVPVTADDYPWVESGEEAFQYWAEPDVVAAAAAMDQVIAERQQ